MHSSFPVLQIISVNRMRYFLMILKQKVLHGELRNLKVGREKSVSFITQSGSVFSQCSV
jgi:hypothetical protein